jgi:hypothetical protein
MTGVLATELSVLAMWACHVAKSRSRIDVGKAAPRPNCHLAPGVLNEGTGRIANLLSGGQSVKVKAKV